QPGMVYVGGTDDGRWVPELMNETSGDPHIMLTQNALADGSYLDYLRELYGDQFNTLSADDSQLAFQQYTADAQKRLQHDLDFPDEPKQVLPGENLQMDNNGHLQISGQTAVMAINQLLLQALMTKNPDMSFAMQESLPLANTYNGALPLGPLMELGGQSAQSQFTADVAAQSVDYWSSMTQSLLSDPNVTGSTTALKSYSHDVNATANLLAANNFTDQAEQAYELASQIYPGNPEPVNGLAKLLTETGHADQAQQLLNQFISQYPDQRSAVQPQMTITGTSAPGH
ncbi:MAG TPA: tetratricopeptide repeat protein, partial [Candidatus Angelobacter sp.]|nr:tetratricopeptide repeat protein [Candidatus Angelobacter sp.]